MKAKSFSKERYYPMLLTNGNDAVLVDYSGSMLTSVANHAHHEQHEGTPCGWYKVSHQKNKPPYNRIQPIVQSGYYIIVDGEICDIDKFEQQFDPKKAILKTTVHAYDVICRIESFLTDDHVLVEHYYVHKVPAKQHTVQLAFFVEKPLTWLSTFQFLHQSDIKPRRLENMGLRFKYNLDDISGDGVLLTDRKPAGFAKYPYEGHGFFFNNIKRGWSITKFLALLDPTDSSKYSDLLNSTIKRCKSKGFPGLREDHVRRWEHYSKSSRVNIPDKKMQYVYDVSNYIIRGYQHRATGAITCGVLPHHWGGGTCLPIEGYEAFGAKLRTNRFDECLDHLRFYKMQRPSARKLAKELKVPGAIYSSWANCFGQHMARDIKDYAMHYKPFMPANIVYMVYWLWRFDPNYKLSNDDLQMVKEILDFGIYSCVQERKDDAVIRPSVPQTEQLIEVENETWTAISYARSLSFFVEMAEAMGKKVDASYKRLSNKLFNGIKGNYEDGILLPFKNATIKAALQTWFFVWNLPDGINLKSVNAAISKRTPWGIDSENPAESYADWSWTNSRASICFSHLGKSKKAFHWLQHSIRHASSLGAMPEKVRIDGYYINNWYLGSHAWLVWALATALCHNGKKGDIRLLWGLDGQWKDLAFDNLRLIHGIKTSVKVEKGKLVHLVLHNTSDADLVKKNDINPLYYKEQFRIVELPAGKKIKVI